MFCRDKAGPVVNKNAVFQTEFIFKLNLFTKRISYKIVLQTSKTWEGEGEGGRGHSLI